MKAIKTWHIIAACAIVYILSLTAGLSLNGDDSNYILIGKSFLEKGFFHEVFVSNELAKTTYYYFMLPLMLMPFIKLAPANYLMMKIIPLVFALGAVLLLNSLAKGEISDRLRKILLILFGLNPWIVEYSGMLLTEMPYIFFALASFVLYRKYRESGRPHLLILSAAAAGASLYARPFGAALCLSLAAFSAVKRRWKDCVIIVAVLLLLGMPVLVHASDLSSAFFNSFVKKSDYYAHESKAALPQQIIGRAGRHLLVYGGNYLPDIIARPAAMPVDPRRPDGSVNPLFALKFLLGSCMSLLIAAGFFQTARRAFQPYHIYAAFHIVMLAAISVYVARYLLPLLPFILFFFLSIAAAIRERGRAARVATAALIGLLIALSLAGAGRQIACARTDCSTAEARSFIECNDWVKAHTPPDAVIVSRKPPYTKLYTGRASAAWIFTDNTAAQLDHILAARADFVIVGDLGFYLHEAGQMMDTVRAHPERFRLLYTTKSKPENYVYKVIR